MKKPKFSKSSFILLAGAAVLTLSSCSKDDPVALPTLSSATYSSSTLALKYCGEEMPGKSVLIEYPKSTKNDCGCEDIEADMTLFSEFDLSQLSGMGLEGSVAGPGVLPGSPHLTIPVTLQPSDGQYVFSGSGSTEYVDFSYSGSLTDGKLTFDVSDCRLKSDALAGKVFSPAPIEKSGLSGYSSLPFHLVWEIDPATGIDIPLTGILQAIFTAPIISVYNNTAYTSVAQMVESDIKTLALLPDGNIPVTYISTVGGAARLATTCGNMLQYVPAPGGMKLYVNPLSALSEVLLALSKPSDDADFVTKTGASDGDGLAGVDPKITKALMEALIVAIRPGLSDGVPLTMAPTAKGAEIYFDTDSSVTLLASLMENLLENPDVEAALKAHLASLDLPSLTPEEVETIMSGLPALLEKTTRLEVGLSLIEDRSSAE